VIAVVIWPEKKWKSVHIFWAVPLFFVAMMALSVVSVLILR